MLNVIRERICHLHGMEALVALREVLGAAKDEGYYQDDLIRCPPGLTEQETTQFFYECSNWEQVNWCGAQACAIGHAYAVFDGIQNHYAEGFFDISEEEDMYLFSDVDGVKSGADDLDLPHYMDTLSEREAARARIAEVLRRHGVEVE